MAHISTGLEYGLHCLLFWSTRARMPPANGRDLAELQGVSVENVAKLFTKLQKARLVVATEGVRGGFRLARPADSISVLDVVTAIHGEEPAVRLPRDPQPVPLFAASRPHGRRAASARDTKSCWRRRRECARRWRRTPSPTSPHAWTRRRRLTSARPWPSG